VRGPPPRPRARRAGGRAQSDSDSVGGFELSHVQCVLSTVTFAAASAADGAAAAQSLVFCSVLLGLSDQDRHGHGDSRASGFSAASCHGLQPPGLAARPGAAGGVPWAADSDTVTDAVDGHHRVGVTQAARPCPGTQADAAG
jgi:hypothetical protein